MRSLFAALTLALSASMVIAPVMAQSSGAAAFGRALGERNQTRQQAYDDEQLMMIRREALIQQARADRYRAELVERARYLRESLAVFWTRAGYDDEMAHAIANAYHPADDDQAILLSVRGQSAEQMGFSIRSALDSRNYQLANQLAVASVLELHRKSAVP